MPRKIKKPVNKPLKPPPGARLLRTSERSSFKTCRFAWDFTYNKRLKPVQEAPALKFGTMIHKALELRYPKGVERGPHPADSFQQIYAETITDLERQWGSSVRDAEGDWEDMLELGVDMLEGFVAEYGDDEDWEIIEPEMTFQVPFRHPERPDQILFWYVGTMDDVRRHRSTGAIRINDYKTTSNDVVKEALGKGVLDEQATAYWTFGVEYLVMTGVLQPKEVDKLDGMLYTFLKKVKEDTRPKNAQGLRLNKPTKKALLDSYKRRGQPLPAKGSGSGKDGAVVTEDLIAGLGEEYALQLGEVSEKQPGPRFHRELVYRTNVDREMARERVFEEYREIVCVEKGLLSARKNPDTGTMGHCGWCGYRDICELHETGADWESLSEGMLVPWDPYDAHEIEEEGKAR